MHGYPVHLVADLDSFIAVSTELMHLCCF